MKCKFSCLPAGLELRIVLCRDGDGQVNREEFYVLLKELGACKSSAARRLRLSAFGKGEEARRKLHEQEAKLEETRSALDKTVDADQIAAVRVPISVLSDRYVVHLVASLVASTSVVFA